MFYKSLTVADDDQERTIPVLKHFYLFNVNQVDGVEIEKPKPRPEPERIIAVEKFVTNTGASIRSGGDRACYSPSRDQIRIPELAAFGEAQSYYSTLLHELSHWTGHKSRLDRAEGMWSRFGDEGYAMEELVAELGSGFLSITLEVAHEPRADHARYLNNWMQVLKVDIKAFTSAASKAQAAADYLEGLQATAEVAALGDWGQGWLLGEQHKSRVSGLGFAADPLTMNVASERSSFTADLILAHCPVTVLKNPARDRVENTALSVPVKGMVGRPKTRHVSEYT